MKKHSFGNFQAELDMDTTAKWYTQSNVWGCEAPGKKEPASFPALDGAAAQWYA